MISATSSTTDAARASRIKAFDAALYRYLLDSLLNEVRRLLLQRPIHIDGLAMLLERGTLFGHPDRQRRGIMAFPFHWS